MTPRSDTGATRGERSASQPNKSELTWAEVGGNEVSKSERWALCEQLLQRLASCLHCDGCAMTDARSANMRLCRVRGEVRFLGC